MHFCNIVNVFSVTFDQLNVSLLRSTTSFKKSKFQNGIVALISLLMYHVQAN